MEMLIRGDYVISMDPVLGDLPVGTACDGCWKIYLWGVSGT